MRSPKIEMMDAFARAESKEALVSFVNNEKTSPYGEEKWQKFFKKGGPLEWCNPPSIDEDSYVDVGTYEKRVDMEIKKFTKWWNESVLGLNEVK
jgi:hypothetical protein